MATLHITRRSLWSEPDGLPITRNEWRACIEADPELKFDGEDAAHWIGKSEAAHALLVWRDGNVEARGADLAFTKKVVAVSAALHAEVQGDGGEKYWPDGFTTPPPTRSFAARLKARLRPLPSAENRGPDPVSKVVVAWLVLGVAAAMALLLFLLVRQ